MLGPLLYLNYVNDIGFSFDAKALSFVNDTTILLYDSANASINCLFKWFRANRLSLNADV